MSCHYLQHFGLAEAPFSIAPSPRFLYMSQRHQEALAHLLYGLEGEGGFVLLTGDVGAGKTTLIRAVLERMVETRDVAYVFNPRLSAEELLAAICEELAVAAPPGAPGSKRYIDALNARLLELHAQGRRATLILDEAQNLDPDVLEQMRLLTNLETSETKLLQIILVGQPELADMLASPKARPLAQRIVARYHLGPLEAREVDAYVAHRLQVAGVHRRLFSASLARRLHRLSGGVPRVINLLCDRALLGAYVLGREQPDRAILEQAARETLGLAAAPRASRLLWLGGAAALLASAALGLRPAPEMPSPVHATAAPAAPAASPERGALDALFQAWGLRYQGGEPCQEARAAGLSCHAARGDLADLARANRPTLLRLRDAGGQAMTLLELTSGRALVASEQGRESLEATVLQRRWSGEYLLLWRAPQAVKATLRPGDQGPGVDWLRAQLRRLDGLDASIMKGTPYDEALRERVRRFQREQGLSADGNLGPLTLLPLMGILDRTAPALRREDG